MEYKELNNGVKMPMLGYGTYQANDNVCRLSVCEAIKTGYRLLDTAEMYGNEKQVGLGIKDSGIDRKELFITTKINFKSYDRATEVVMSSLENLQTNYLDLVLLHWPFGNYYFAWRELEKLYAAGKIRAIGISNFDSDRMIDLINFNKVVPAVNQIETHIFCQRKAEKKRLEKYGVCHMAYSPLGQGQSNEMFSLPETTGLAKKYKKTPAQILLRFLIQSDVIVIPKSVHANRIRENFDIFDFSLTDDEMDILRRLDKNTPRIGKAEDPDFTEVAMRW